MTAEAHALRWPLLPYEGLGPVPGTPNSMNFFLQPMRALDPHRIGTAFHADAGHRSQVQQEGIGVVRMEAAADAYGECIHL